MVEDQVSLVILGDKGYVGKSLMALIRANSKTNWPKVCQLIFKLRRCVVSEHI